jgi:hypothetical protein
MGAIKVQMAEIVEKMRKQFEAKPILVFVVPLLFLLLLSAIILLILFSGGSGEDTYTPPDTVGGSAIPVMGDAEQTPTIEILPETERAVPEKDPFGSSGVFYGPNSFRLTGIISSSSGTSAAIIVAGNRSFILQAGDLIGETDWSIAEISGNSVIITDGENEETLELDPNKK